MRARVMIVMAVLGAMLVCTGAAYAQYGAYGRYGAEQPKPYLRAKVGWFEPNESTLNGDVAFGVDYIIPAQTAYITVDRLHTEDTDVKATSWSILGGIYRMAEVGKRQFYYGAGLGLARQKLQRTGLPDKDDDNVAWEVCAGTDLGRNGFAEVKYRDGGEDGNKGFILYLGTNLAY